MTDEATDKPADQPDEQPSDASASSGGGDTPPSSGGGGGNGDGGTASGASMPDPEKSAHEHSNALLIAIIIGVVLGIAGGLLFPASFDDSGEIVSPGITELSFLGDMFLNMLFMIVVPLIMSSMIVGIASLGDIRNIGRIGKVTILFYVTTTIIAVILGITLAVIVQPGGGQDAEFFPPTLTSAPRAMSLGPAGGGGMADTREFIMTVPDGTRRAYLRHNGEGVNVTWEHLDGDTSYTISATDESAAPTGWTDDPGDDVSYAGRWRVVFKNTKDEKVGFRVHFSFKGAKAVEWMEKPRELTLPEGPRVMAINLPKRPTGLELGLHGAPTDVRVYVRQGEPVDPENLETASYELRGSGDGTATLDINKSSSHPVKAGTWYLLFVNGSGSEQTINFEARIDAPAGEKSFIRPDMSLGERIWAFVKDFAERLFPKNIMQAMVETNVLPLIIFALVFGAVLTVIGPKGAPVIALAEGVFEAIMKIVGLIMWFAPVGIFALVATKVGESPDLMAELGKLAAYVGVVLGGLAIHALIVLPILLKVLTGRSPLQYAAGMGKALLTAFSTASSNATLPMTVECLVDENQVSKKSAEFVIPLGATINMDGTALYEAVAVIFMAQLMGVPLDLSAYIIISITATLAAIGAAGIPEAGTVTMVMVLLAVGLPAEAVGYILAIDWFLDRCRTTVNVWGDSVGAAVADVQALDAPRGDPAADGGNAPTAETASTAAQPATS